MSDNTKTILYKDYQIEIASEATEQGAWRPIWWIWISDEALMFSTDELKTTQLEALQYAENAARGHVDSLVNG